MPGAQSAQRGQAPRARRRSTSGNSLIPAGRRRGLLTIGITPPAAATAALSRLIIRSTSFRSSPAALRRWRRSPGIQRLPAGCCPMQISMFRLGRVLRPPAAGGARRGACRQQVGVGMVEPDVSEEIGVRGRLRVRLDHDQGVDVGFRAEALQAARPDSWGAIGRLRSRCIHGAPPRSVRDPDSNRPSSSQNPSPMIAPGPGVRDVAGGIERRAGARRPRLIRNRANPLLPIPRRAHCVLRSPRNSTKGELLSVWAGAFRRHAIGRQPISSMITPMGRSSLFPETVRLALSGSVRETSAPNLRMAGVHDGKAVSPPSQQAPGQPA
jgi:hypothetical protein